MPSQLSNSMTHLRVVGWQVCLNTPVISLTTADFGGKWVILKQFRPFEHRRGHEVDGGNEVVSAETLLMVYELLQLIATRITLKKSGVTTGMRNLDVEIASVSRFLHF